MLFFVILLRFMYLPQITTSILSFKKISPEKCVCGGGGKKREEMFPLKVYSLALMHDTNENKRE